MERRWIVPCGRSIAAAVLAVGLCAGLLAVTPQPQASAQVLAQTGAQPEAQEGAAATARALGGDMTVGGEAVDSAAVDSTVTGGGAAHGDAAGRCVGLGDEAPDASAMPWSAGAVAAPAALHRCRVQGVHADAMSVYATGGEDPELLLDSRIDGIGPAGANGVRYDAGSLAYVLGDNARQPASVLPRSMGWLKDEIGEGDFWFIPQTQEPGVLWAGMSSEPLAGDPRVDRAGKVTLTLDSFRGPGSMYLWTQDAEGAVTRVLGSGSGFPAAHELSIPQHEHMNWAFTRPGRYTYTMSAHAVVGGAARTASREYLFLVGQPAPEPAEAVVSAGAVQASPGADGGDADGGIMTGLPYDLTATVRSDAFDWPQGWVRFDDAGVTLGYAKVLPGGSATLPVAGFAEPGDHTVRAVFTPRYGEDLHPAETSFTVRVSGERLPDRPDWADDAPGFGDPGGLADLGRADAGRSTMALELTGAAPGDIVHAGLFVGAKKGAESAAWKEYSGQWVRVGERNAITVPVPAQPGTYALAVRDGRGSTVASATFTVPAAADGDAPGIVGDAGTAPGHGADHPASDDADHDGGDVRGDVRGDDVRGDEVRGDTAPGTDASGDRAGDGTGNGTGDGADPDGDAPRDDGRHCVFRPELVLDQGHVDLAAFSSASDPFRMVIQEDVTGDHVRWAPGIVMLWLRPEARTARGWSVPQTQRPGLLWMGWNNQFLADRDTAVTWTIDRFEGPGSMRIWLQGNLGAGGRTVLDGSGSGSFEIAANTHAHANWDFSAEGYYLFRATYSSRLGSDSAWVHVTVGDLDPYAMPIPCGEQGAPGGRITGMPVAAAGGLAGGADGIGGGRHGRAGRLGTDNGRRSRRDRRDSRARSGNRDRDRRDRQGAILAEGAGPGSEPVTASADGLARGFDGMVARHPVLAAVMFAAIGGGVAVAAACASVALRRRRSRP